MGCHGGTASCWSGRMVWPLVALAVTGVGLGIAISFSGKWRKIVSSSKEDCYFREDDDGDMEEDRISQLPDDLLSKILSSLHLQEAARTSILGRRWRNIWALRSILGFDCIDMFGIISPHNNCTRRMYRFVNAVDQTLRFASSQKITSALISCCFAKKFVPDFRRWVQILVSSGAVELEFRFFCSSLVLDSKDKMFAFPFDLLFQAVSLKRLHLFYCALKPNFTGHFESLEYLHLCDVPLDDGEVPKIFSACVNLRRFLVRQCDLPPYLCISGPCLSLKFLEIDSCRGLRWVDLRAVNLTTFICYNFHSIGYTLSCCLKLKQISVNCDGKGTVPNIFGEVAKCCSDLKSMLFQTTTDTLQYLPVKTSLFSKLVQLELLMIFEFRVDLMNVIPILDACPVLEKFHLLAISSVLGKLPEARWPTLCYSHLKEVKFSGFLGMRNEIEFASFLVRSAPVLEQLLIQPYYEYYSLPGYWLRRVVARIDTEKRRLISDELSRQAVSSRVEVLFGRDYVDRHSDTDHPSNFLPIFSELDE